MKANHPHRWSIKLAGKTSCKRALFTGRLDEALAHADELESAVPFVVLTYTIKRLNRAKASASVSSVSALRLGSV